MNNTKKMIMVPYVPQRPDRDVEQLSRFDEEMSLILANKKLTANEKAFRYNQLLDKYITKDNDIQTNIDLRPHLVNRHESFIKSETIDPKLKLKEEDEEQDQEYFEDELVFTKGKPLFTPETNKKIIPLFTFGSNNVQKDYENKKLLSSIKTRKQRKNEPNVRRVTDMFPFDKQKKYYNNNNNSYEQHEEEEQQQEEELNEQQHHLPINTNSPVMFNIDETNINMREAKRKKSQQQSDNLLFKTPNIKNNFKNIQTPVPPISLHFNEKWNPWMKKNY